jgi:small conductance mechanosensitive channel
MGGESMEGMFDLSGTMQTLTDMVAEFGLSALGALAVLVIGIWVAKRIRVVLRSSLGKTTLDPILVQFTSSMLYYGLLAFVVVAVLEIFGVSTASFVVVLGAAGLAVGLALQGTLSNFASGVMLLIFRPFKLGQWVEVAGVAGSVREIGIFSTILFTGDNVRVVVPNSQIYGQVMKNFTANETRRIDLVMGVSYDDDLQVAQDTILRVLGSDERVLADPAPTVAVSELGDSSVDFVVRPWCNTGDYWALRWDLLRRLKEELEAAGCSIPYPQRDVHLHQ